MVTALKKSCGKNNNYRKLIIAYINIGEAENWRWYWTWSKDWPEGEKCPSHWPDYIVTPDPDGWEGNFPVAFWTSSWKDIIIYGKNQPPSSYRNYTSAIDEAMRDGFDGIYLDWVEAYEEPLVEARALQEGKNPAEEMVMFIKEIRNYTESRKEGFIIIQQNASPLGLHHPELLNYIDAIAQEAIWYDGTGFGGWEDFDGYDKKTEKELTCEYIQGLEFYLKSGLPVFNVEYALNFSDEAYKKSKEEGYITYCSRRSLYRLSTTPPPGY